MPNPMSLFTCRGPRTGAVSWRTENQIINSSYHNKNSPDPEWRVIGLPTTLDVFNAIPTRLLERIGKDSLDSHTTSVLQACAIKYVLIASKKGASS
jgi:hypothetical protein